MTATARTLRFDAIKDIGCIVFLNRGIGFVPCEIHHLLPLACTETAGASATTQRSACVRTTTAALALRLRSLARPTHASRAHSVRCTRTSGCWPTRTA